MRLELLIAAAVLATPALAADPRVSVAQLRHDFQKPGDRYVTLKGVELRYRDEGRGPAVLLLHGSRSTLNAWDGVAAALLSDGYRVIRYDQPPAGLSGPVSDAAVAAVGQPEALPAALLDALHVAKASVVGVSSGGTLAYYFAATYPDRVDALVLSNTPSDSVARLVVKNSPGLDAALAADKPTGIESRDFWQQYLTFLYGDPSRLKPATVDYYYRTNLRTIEPNAFRLHALTANQDVTMAHLKAVKAPVLILWGMRDPVLTPEAGKALVGYLPNSVGVSFVGLPDVGHYPPMEVPGRFAGMVDAYIKAVRP